jgi:FkbM family methyltransferase
MRTVGRRLIFLSFSDAVEACGACGACGVTFIREKTWYEGNEDMLLDLRSLAREHGMRIRGVLHGGAHECQEMEVYRSVAPNARVVWVEANPAVAERVRARGVADVYQALLSDEDGREVDFMVTNNEESSSMLELAEHRWEHPDVVEVARVRLRTSRLDSLLSRVAPGFDFNFVNLDIQGAELLALRGLGEDRLARVDYVYTEVNERELYRGCALLPEVDAFLCARGFRRAAIEMTRHGWGDALFVREK